VSGLARYFAKRNNIMSSIPSPVGMKTAEEHLMRFLAVEGLPGQEKAIGEPVILAISAKNCFLRRGGIHRDSPVHDVGRYARSHGDGVLRFVARLEVAALLTRNVHQEWL
jgi:hypothetical protein